MPSPPSPTPSQPTPAAQDSGAALVTDVLVVGAGPAGSACAQALARAGMRVLLVDQHDFPRDKVCGDGLIPDAHAAFARLGVEAEVRAAAQSVSHVGCVAPRGGRVNVAGRLAVLPRRVLDDLLRRAAVAAGAQWLPNAKFRGVLEEDSRVVGATLSVAQVASKDAALAGSNDAPASGLSPDAVNERRVHARWVVLATGAVPQALLAAGMATRRTPSGVALRGYIHNAHEAERITTMDVVWHKALRRGYGWIFPAPDGVYNVGVGLAHSHAKDAEGRETMADVNLREMFDAFCRVHPPVKRLVEGGRWMSPLKGAPLRCSLEGARLARPGLLVCGEAAGSTYAFTGEGIGKAMETGLLAADALIDDARRAPTSRAELDVATIAAYQASVLALKPRFDLYERANKVNDAPWLVDLLVWRANKSARIMRRMENVLEERGNPGNLVSARGLLKLFVPLK